MNRLKCILIALLFVAEAVAAAPLIFTPANTPRTGSVLMDGGLTVTETGGENFFAERAINFGINNYNSGKRPSPVCKEQK